MSQWKMNLSIVGQRGKWGVGREQESNGRLIVPEGPFPLQKLCHHPGNIMKDWAGEITPGLKEGFHTMLS